MNKDFMIEITVTYSVHFTINKRGKHIATFREPNLIIMGDTYNELFQSCVDTLTISLEDFVAGRKPFFYPGPQGINETLITVTARI